MGLIPNLFRIPWKIQLELICGEASHFWDYKLVELTIPTYKSDEC